MESIVPPYPADVVTVFGAYLAGQGKLNPFGVYGSVVSGGILGVMWMYYLGKWKGREFFSKKRKFFSIVKVEKLEALFKEQGTLILIFNRFLVGVRAVVFLAAGIGGMAQKRVWILGTVSILIWYIFLIYLGMVLGERSGNIVKKVVWITTGIAFGFGIMIWMRKKMKTGITNN